MMFGVILKGLVKLLVGDVERVQDLIILGDHVVDVVASEVLVHIFVNHVFETAPVHVPAQKLSEFDLPRSEILASDLPHKSTSLITTHKGAVIGFDGGFLIAKHLGELF